MENKKVREVKLLNGETARSVLAQNASAFIERLSNKCTFVYSLSRFIDISHYYFTA